MTARLSLLCAVALAGIGLGCSKPAPDAVVPPTPPALLVTPAKTSAAAPSSGTACKGNEIDDGDHCRKRCETDKDCGGKGPCGSMMVENPNGGSSSALVCP